MKLVYRTAIYHFVCILFFAFLYFIILDEFSLDKNKNYTFLDYFSLSTTIQCGVGFSDMFPTTTIGKILVISQQFIMIVSHIITLYFFTI